MIAVTFRRQNGKCSMVIDAAEFHNYLRTLGAEVDEDEATFKAGPTGTSSTYIDNYAGKMRPSALLTGVGKGPITIDLAEYYARPLNIDQLKGLASSVSTLASDIVEHYRPIEISVRIVGKKSPAEVIASAEGPF